MKYDYSGKTVIVTGAGSGLGECIAKEFSKYGANVVLVDRNEEGLKRVYSEIGKNAVYCVLDVTKYSQITKLVDMTIEHFGKIDILINNAGICKMMPIDDMPLELVDSILDINLKGTIYGCKAVAKHMIEQKSGKIINMSSIAGKLCGENSSIYSTSKAGVMAFTTSLARELAPYNINVNSILPGIIRTSMWEGLLDDFTNKDESIREGTFDSFTNSIPMKRPQEPIDIANMVLYLCSDDARNVTAQNIAVDGGHTA